jgi:TolB-like protein
MMGRRGVRAAPDSMERDRTAMHRALLVLAVIVLFAPAVPGGAAAPAKPRVAVAAVTSVVKSPYAARALETALLDALVNSGRFEVVTRGQLDRVLAEQKLQNSDLVDPAEARRVGRLLGAQYLVVGSLLSADFEPGFFSKDRFLVKAQLQLVEVETGRIRTSDTFTGTRIVLMMKRKTGIGTELAPAEERKSIGEGAEAIARQFADRVGVIEPLEGYVVAVEGARVAINLGEASGVRPGQEFVAYTEGRRITDPVTGEVLAVERRKVARLVVTSVEEKLAWTDVVVTHSPTATATIGGEAVDLAPVVSVLEPAMPVLQTVARAQEIRKDLARLRAGARK